MHSDADTPSKKNSTLARQNVAVYVCTYRRNDPLKRMLDSLSVAAQHATAVANLAVIVVDDNPDGAAQTVVDSCPHSFALGLHYVHVGTGNIAAARNAGLEAAMELGDWVAMVDDDQTVVPEWLTELLTTIERTGADAVTAPVYPRFPTEAPEFLNTQRFADLWGTPVKEDGVAVTDLQTANSIIRTSFLADNPDVRFSKDLGKVGGEDMVFYRAALDRGLKAHYSLNAVNWEYYDGERGTYRYQLRRSLWLGNTEAVTELRAGRASKQRLLARAAKRLVGALVLEPAGRVRNGEDPHLRFAGAYALQAAGLILGAAGVRLEHR